MKIEAKRALDELARQFDVPGWSLVRWRGDQTQFGCGGVISTTTGVPVTPETLFLIGSVAKLYTAAMVARLVREGQLALEEDIRLLVPELGALDRPTTIRALLSHTSGLDGDLYLPEVADTGVASLLTAWSELPRIAEPGVIFSYSNAGYCALGAAVSRLTGLSWDQAVRSIIIGPLGLTHTEMETARLSRYRVAIGHGRDGAPLERYRLSASHAASGTTLAASARDVMAFLRNFDTLVGPEVATAMKTTAVRLPEGGAYPEWGLGWMAFSHPRRLVGHDGETSRQFALARMEPGGNEGCVVLVNGGRAGAFFRRALDLLAPDLNTFASPPKAAKTTAETLRDYEGEYAKVDSVLRVRRRRGFLIAEISRAQDPLETVDEGSYELAPTGPDCFWARAPDGEMLEPLVFVRDDSGAVAWAHVHGRAFARLPPKLGRRGLEHSPPRP